MRSAGPDVPPSMAKRKKMVTAKRRQPKEIEETIRLLRKYSDRLKSAIEGRLEEMKGDDRSHCLIYQVLGVGDREGRLVDEYQNKGRFLYKYAGSFLEEAAKLCFQEVSGIGIGSDTEYPRPASQDF